MTIRYGHPAILGRIDCDRHTVIEASAGTGKTFTIEHLVVHLIVTRGASIREILVLTFADRAATELRARVRSTLLAVLLARADRGDAEPAWTIGPDERRRIESALFEFELAPIHTIHAFYRGILSSHGFAAGRMLELEQEAGERLLASAVRDALRGPIPRDPVAWQIWAAWALGRRDPVAELIRTLGRCRDRSVGLHPPPRVAELSALFAAPRLARALSPAGVEAVRAGLKRAKVHASTARAVMTRLETVAAIFQPLAHPIDATWLATVHGAAVLEALHDLKQPDRALDAATEEAFATLHELRLLMLTPDALVLHVLLPIVERELARAKQRDGVIEFEDMIAEVQLALAGEQGGALAADLRRRYRFALVDEFQDTDAIQWDILRRVFIESGQAGERRSVLFMVGDPKQAIYGFRGADVHAYLDAVRSVAPAPEDRVALSRNFRSTAPMVGAFNALFDQDDPLPFFTGEIQYRPPVTCGRPDLVLEDAKGAEGPALHLMVLDPELVHGATAARAAHGRAIAAEIRNLVGGKSAVRTGQRAAGTRPLEHRQIYILTLTNREGDHVARHLGEAGIPYAFYKKGGLFDSREAADILHLLEAVADPRDPSRRRKAWLTPFFEVPLERIRDCAEVSESDPLLARLVRWKALADAHRFDQLFSRIITESGVLRRDLFTGESERRLTNTLHIFEILLEQAHARGHDLDRLAHELREYTAGREAIPGESGDVQRLETERSAVQIMTMHRSKGLEAPVVFLYGGLYRKPQAFPLFRKGGRRWIRVGPDPNVEDEVRREVVEEGQRLLYVALTRAAARVYLPVLPQNRQGKSTIQVTQPYQQLNERLLRLRGGATCPVQVHRVVPAPPPFVAGASPAAAASPDLLAAPERFEEYQKIRAAHRDWVVTSYSAMHRHRFEAPVPEEPQAEVASDPGEAYRLAEDDLPGGIDTGLLLHELLEEVDLVSLAGATSYGAWAASPQALPQLYRHLARYGVDPRHASTVRRMVYDAWTLPVELANERVARGLRACEPLQREVEFLYPYPQPGHPPAFDAEGDDPVIDSGYVKGFIDLLFTWNGRVYFADWKSDALSEYGPAALAAHSERRYVLQMQLYTIAVVKLLGVTSERAYEERFGGFLYVFLRGLAPGAGMHADRPSWASVLEWESAIRNGPAPQDLLASRRGDPIR